MKNNDNEEDHLNVIIGDNDSELIDRLKELIDKTSHKLPTKQI